MPLVEGTYIPTSKENIYDVLELELQEAFGVEGDITSLSVLSSLVDAFSETLHERQEHEIASIYEAAFLDTAVGEDLEHVVAILGLERIAATHATGVIKFYRDTPSSHEYTIQKGTIVQTRGPNPIRFETTEAVVIPSGQTSVKADIRAVSGGSEGNLADNTLEVMPSPPDGVDGCTNPKATGNPNLFDTDGDELVVGRDQETDAELRERASVTVTKGGAATVDALLSCIINNKDLPSVQSVSIFNNRTYNDNTGSGGLPPKSFEMVVYGGREQTIAEAIFDTMSVTSHDYSGVHGQTVTRSVKGINGQTWDVTFSRPTAIDIDLTIDMVITDEYVGDTEIKDRIVDYVGGTNSEGEEVLGQGVGESIYIDTIEDIVTGTNETGVIGTTNIQTTPTTTTGPNGLPIIDVGGGEVGSTNARDKSITLNTTKK